MIKGNLEVAEQKYRQALKINPKYNYGLENLAMCLNNQGLKTKPAQSAQLFHQALYIHDTPTVRANLKESLKLLGFDDTKFDDRRKFAERCLANSDTIGAIIEYEAALKIKDDAAIRTKLASLKAPAGTPLRLKDLNLKPAGIGSQENNVQSALLMQEIQRKSSEHWSPKKSQTSRPTIVDFLVNTDGSIKNLKVHQSSGDAALDESALAAIRAAAPFTHIPKVPKGESIDIRFTFDYNAQRKPKK
jgi:TonB family protein